MAPFPPLATPMQLSCWRPIEDQNRALLELSVLHATEVH